MIRTNSNYCSHSRWEQRQQQLSISTWNWVLFHCLRYDWYCSSQMSWSIYTPPICFGDGSPCYVPCTTVSHVSQCLTSQPLVQGQLLLTPCSRRGTVPASKTEWGIKSEIYREFRCWHRKKVNKKYLLTHTGVQRATGIEDFTSSHLTCCDRSPTSWLIHLHVQQVLQLAAHPSTVEKVKRR